MNLLETSALQMPPEPEPINLSLKKWVYSSAIEISFQLGAIGSINFQTYPTYTPYF